MKKILLCLTTLLVVPSCHRPSVTSRRTLNLKKEMPTLNQSQPTATPYVTVWIHGTRGFKPFDEIVHAAPPSSGLQTITSLGNNYNRFKNMAKTIAQTDPIKYPIEHFYIFGWSGDLSFNVRHDAAAQLHKHLEKLVATYTKKYGHAPFIRLITHSHGGNVALNLATIEHTNKEWFINEVILLACPVQHKTEKLITSPLFGKIYSFYSTIDTVQIADPQGFYKKECLPEDKGIFSQRRFPDHEKLVQIKLRINNHGVPHSCFTLCNFLHKLPTVINSLDQWEEEQPHRAHEVRQLTVLL
jgi:hypothetical protein